MSNAFYAPGKQRAEKVGNLFATIARHYDLINDLQSFGLHRRWKRRVVELAEANRGDRALDVCCGTGDLAFMLVAREVEVTGLDFSAPMLSIAEGRRPASDPQSAVRNPQFILGDAQAIPFPDASFDIATVGYGLRNLASWEAGLAEIARVLKPRGRMLVLDFGKPANSLWRGVYFGYLKTCVPLFGLIFAGRADAYAYILESLKHYPAQLGVEAKMRELGLINVRIQNLLAGAMSINYGEKPSSPKPQTSTRT